MFDLEDEDYPGLLKLAEKSSALSQAVLKALAEKRLNKTPLIQHEFRNHLLNLLTNLDASFEFFVSHSLVEAEIDKLNKDAAFKIERYRLKFNELRAENQ